MDAAGTRGGQTYSEFARIFRIAARHKRRRLFMSHLYKPNFILPLAKRLHNAVNSVAGQAEYDVHSPIDQRFNQYIGSRFFHYLFSFHDTSERLIFKKSESAIPENPLPLIPFRNPLDRSRA